MPRMGGGLTTKHIPWGTEAVAAISWPVSCSAPTERADQSLRGRKMVPAFVRSPPPMRSKPLMANAWKTAGWSAGVLSKAGTMSAM